MSTGTGRRRPDASTVVIFGASGDLTQRKLVPALYSLFLGGLLSENFAIVGYARRPKPHDQFREEMQTATSQHARLKATSEGDWARFAAGLFYCQGEFEQDGDYLRLKAMLDEIDAARGTQGRRLFYLATPPAAYPTIIAALGRAGLITEGESSQWTRVIIEKPFGYDLPSARTLNRQVLAVLDESQVYRIDHYLGKETTQNILAFRFGNSIFEPLWNRRYIDHVQITVAENLGVLGRGGYYDTAGAFRDIVQNHMMQVFALVAMEPPAAFTADGVRDEKVKALQAACELTPTQTVLNSVRAQYVAGNAGGQAIPNYRAESGVRPDSQTETYVALKLMVENWRWAGVPFYLRTGKALAARVTEVTIQFRPPPLMLFHHTGHDGVERGHVSEPNRLSLRIQPNESISLSVGLKVPGPEIVLRPVEMDFVYKEVFGTEPPEAYERLLRDALIGDHTLFIRRDEVEVSWELADSVLNVWRAGAPAMVTYPAGSWGPSEADELLARDGRTWAELK